MSTVPLISSVARLAGGYDAWLCDIWGVMHDGLKAHPAAVDACRRYREKGGVVVFISNAPRPSKAVLPMFDRVGVPHDSYDAIVTSGDVTRSVISETRGARIFHLGPPRDLPIFEGLDTSFVEPKQAQWVVCTGLDDDDTETPDVYADVLRECAGLGLPMICANPDLMVERGDKLVYCAGTLALEYEKLGGEVTYTGKPHLPIYERALAMAVQARGRDIPRRSVLAIGDGLRTDIAGAANAGLDALFVASRLHVNGSGEGEVTKELAELFAGGAKLPVAAQLGLAW
ncbi:MAG: TIGR01459 family HAD-type hydrolase [Hyphomicrobiales bacterium]